MPNTSEQDRRRKVLEQYVSTPAASEALREEASRILLEDISPVIGMRPDSEDLAHEALMRCWDYLAQQNGKPDHERVTIRNPTSWARRIAINVLYDRLRERGRAITATTETDIGVRDDETGFLDRLSGESLEYGEPITILMNREEGYRWQDLLRRVECECGEKSRIVVNLRVQSLSWDDCGRHIGETAYFAQKYFKNAMRVLKRVLSDWNLATP